MKQLSNKQFEQIAAEALDSLPSEITRNMNNVVIVTEKEPTAEQLVKLHLVNGETLLGLYEGVPLTARGSGYNLVLPDKITIFKNPLLDASSDLQDLKQRVKRTIWHEIAHHYGLNHDRIDNLIYKN